MALKLALLKEGEQPQASQKLRLSLNKGARFTVELAWDSEHDLDAHALLCANDGSRATVDSFDKVLSCYNTKKANPQGTLPVNPNGSFQLPCGALVHSGDSRSGLDSAIDEVITIDGSMVPSGMNEIPVFITIHNAVKNGVTFNKVGKASILIKDDSGKELCHYELTSEFGTFNAVQMGSLMYGPNGWEFAAVGRGFNGDFNNILEFFS